MEFWKSEIGELSGKAEDAFTKIFSVIPDNTTTIAKIDKFIINENFYQIEWKITEGEFKNQHVFQKIKAFDADPKKRHRALNMMMYIYNLFNVKPNHSSKPTEDDLKVFIDKHAGIKIKEWSMERTDSPGFIEGNFVSEIYPAQNFKCEIGKKIEKQYSIVDSAFTRNNKIEELQDEIPF